MYRRTEEEGGPTFELLCTEYKSRIIFINTIKSYMYKVVVQNAYVLSENVSSKYPSQIILNFIPREIVINIILQKLNINVTVDGCVILHLAYICICVLCTLN